MARIAYACQSGAAATSLHRALTEGGRIRELLMIKDISKVEARDSHINARKGYIKMPDGLLALARPDASNVVVGTCLPVIEVYAH